MFLKFAKSDVLEARIAHSGDGLLKSAHKATFDYVPREGYLYVRSRAISSRTNDNFDSWPAGELRQAWGTFIGKPVFVNHHNEDIKRKRGVIIDACLHEDIAPDGTEDVWIEVLMEIDAIKFPMLAKAILAGDIERTSMGADVGESVCSYCGNVATTPSTYCEHIKHHKGQRLLRVASDGTREEVLVHEECRKISFFENSVLVEPPADPTAFFLGVDDRGVRPLGMVAKTASKTAAGPIVVARGLVARPEKDQLTKAVADRFVAGTASAEDVVKLVTIDDGRAGIWWGVIGGPRSDFGVEDVQEYACAEETMAKYKADGYWDEYENWGELGVVLIGETSYDPINNPPELLMGNSYLPDNQPVKLTKVMYNAGNGWKTVNASGLTVKAAKISKDPYAELTDAQKERFAGTTVRQDDKGFYCHTHRARGKSYPSIDEIPDDEVSFIETTGALTSTFDRDVEEEMTRMATRRKNMWRNAAGSKTYTVVQPGASSTFEMHISGCGDLSSPKYQLATKDDVSADSVDQAMADFLDEQMREQGYSESDFKVFPCARSGIPVAPKAVDPDACPMSGQAIDNPKRLMRMQCPSCKKFLGTGSGRWPKHKPGRGMASEASFETEVQQEMTKMATKKKNRWRKTAGALDYGPTTPGPDAGTRWEGIASLPNSRAYKVVVLWPGDEAPLLSGVFDSEERAQEWGSMCVEAGGIVTIENAGTFTRVSKTAATQAEADQLLTGLDAEHRQALEKFVPYTVYGPGYNRSIASNLADAIMFAKRGEERSYLLAWSKCEAALDIATGGEDNWYYDSSMGQYTKRLASKTAGLMFLPEQDGDPDDPSNDGSVINVCLPDKDDPMSYEVVGHIIDWGGVMSLSIYGKGEISIPSSIDTKDKVEHWVTEQFARRGVTAGKPETMTWDEYGQHGEEKPELITWDEWEMAGSTNYGLGYSAGSSKVITLSEALDWGVPTDVESFTRGFQDAQAGRPKTASTKLAWGETKAPPKVNTLGLVECPVCSSTNNFDTSGRCTTCGHLPAPEPFRQPDLEVAQKVDMRDGWVNPDLLAAPAFVPPDEATDGEENDPADPVRSATSARKEVEGVEGDTMRPSEAVIARQSEQLRRLAAENAILRRRAGLAVTADADNPAQPVPEPGASAPTQSTDDARAADTTTEVTTPGAALTDTTPETTTEVTTPGAALTDTAPDATTDVTSPVSGTQDPVPYDQAVTLVQPDASGASNGNDRTNAFADDHSWVQSSMQAASSRVYACLRLARLRIEAGLATGDDITVAQQIQANLTSDEALRTEIRTLAAVRQATGARTASAGPRRESRAVPGIASVVERPMAVTASSFGVSPDEVLW